MLGEALTGGLNLFGLYFDWTYLLVLAGVILSAIASAAVNSQFNKYAKVMSFSHMTGAEVAEKILQISGVQNVRIEKVSGSLTDHYDPSAKVLRLSDSVYGSASVAAIGVAAHECGHAVQHAKKYAPLALRSIAVPLANFGSALSWPLVVIGLIFGISWLAKIGIIFFCAVVFFQLITLPVEINASRRALNILEGHNILIGDEMKGAKKVLTAAACTYLAALFSSVLQLLRLILLTRRRD